MSSPSSPLSSFSSWFSSSFSSSSSSPSSPQSSFKSLAISVHFKHPDLGMTKYEILSRATAFLLSVDPPQDHNDETTTTSNFSSHISKSQQKRDELLLKQDYSPIPAVGPSRNAKDLGWLEFCPGKHRPLVHVLTSAHVLSPWLWPKYYSEGWLKDVRREHVKYSLEVLNSSNDDGNNIESLGKFNLSPYPIHHPEGLDLSVVHLQNEEDSLKQMIALGVQVLHLEDTDERGMVTFEKDRMILFDGFEITSEPPSPETKRDDDNDTDQNDDNRIFVPYSTTGNILYASAERVLASTGHKPLPEGLCGGPALDPKTGLVAGIVEGIVPLTHDEKSLAGAASYVPSFRIKSFMDYAERHILEQILPSDLFGKVVDIKDGKDLNVRGDGKGGTIDMTRDKIGGGGEDMSEGDMDRMHEDIVKGMKKVHTHQEVDAIMGTVEREQAEVLEMIGKDGGDLDEIVAKVRARTRRRQKEIMVELNNNVNSSSDYEDENEKHETKSYNNVFDRHGNGNDNAPKKNESNDDFIEEAEIIPKSDRNT